MKRNEKLPDVSQWQPERKNEDTLSNALMMTCQDSQRRIVARAEGEIAFNRENFDSGLGVEDIVREEFANLLPQRYSIASGVVNDRSGKSAGECDMVIRDPIWSPVIKPGATTRSRRFRGSIGQIICMVTLQRISTWRVSTSLVCC